MIRKKRISWGMREGVQRDKGKGVVVMGQIKGYRERTRQWDCGYGALQG
jgi:hypothetical protein